MTKGMAFGLLLATTAVPAFALEEPRCGPKDMRICTAPYDPSNVIHIKSAPGSLYLVQFAKDEKIVKVKSDDYNRLGKDGSGYIGNLLTLKFNGCLMPEPLFVFTQRELKGGGFEGRPYAFQVDTIPRICSTKVPGPGIPTVSAPDSGGFIKAANAAVIPPPPVVGGEPNLVHLEHPDDLATGRIPYMLRISYPSDEAAERHAVRVKRRAERSAELAKSMLNYASGSQSANRKYYGFGDRELKPSAAYDDGYTTTFTFPQMQGIPALTRIENPKSPWCGIKESGEATTDFSVHGGEMRIGSTAVAYCLRYGNKVYEVYNAGYNGIGFTPGTGTSSPQVDRVVGEGK